MSEYVYEVVIRASLNGFERGARRELTYFVRVEEFEHSWAMIDAFRAYGEGELRNVQVQKVSRDMYLDQATLTVDRVYRHLHHDLAGSVLDEAMTAHYLRLRPSEAVNRGAGSNS